MPSPSQSPSARNAACAAASAGSSGDDRGEFLSRRCADRISAVADHAGQRQHHVARTARARAFLNQRSPRRVSPRRRARARIRSGWRRSPGAAQRPCAARASRFLLAHQRQTECLVHPRPVAACTVDITQNLFRIRFAPGRVSRSATSAQPAEAQDLRCAPASTSSAPAASRSRPDSRFRTLPDGEIARWRAAGAAIAHRRPPSMSAARRRHCGARCAPRASVSPSNGVARAMCSAMPLLCTGRGVSHLRRRDRAARAGSRRRRPRPGSARAGRSRWHARSVAPPPSPRRAARPPRLAGHADRRGSPRRIAPPAAAPARTTSPPCRRPMAVFRSLWQSVHHPVPSVHIGARHAEAVIASRVHDHVGRRRHVAVHALRARRAGRVEVVRQASYFTVACTGRTRHCPRRSYARAATCVAVTPAWCMQLWRRAPGTPRRAAGHRGDKDPPR